MKEEKTRRIEPVTKPESRKACVHGMSAGQPCLECDQKRAERPLEVNGRTLCEHGLSGPCSECGQ